MPFSDVYLVSDKLDTIPQDEIAHLQESLGFPLPIGYAEFMSTLGIGEFCFLVRVYEPDRILAEYREARTLWRELFSWENGRDVLPKSEVLKCVIFADSVDGDYVVFHPDIRDRLFILPRHDDRIYWVPGSFLNPLEWYNRDGPVEQSPAFKWFESYRDRECLEFFTSLRTLELPELTTLISGWWPDSEVHVLEWAEDEIRVARVFVKSIGGNIQLYQDMDDRSVSISIGYDSDSTREVTELANHLKTLGFDTRG